ncbi:hypothetical protein G9464_01745 [Halostella sp. JP-L12]|uniref:hypothetical protein n=1 Tax=Halostella TaxID=1843185 RepID=UPI000EF78E00|nr:MULTISPECIES: hypothetical protein [Halostella]NHN46323.1 hypothetical protein [Halostella sp. JP-L12]
MTGGRIDPSDQFTPDDEVTSIREEPGEFAASDPFEPATTRRAITLWVLTPSVSAVLSVLLSEFAPV